MNEQDFTLLNQYFNGELPPLQAQEVLSRVGAEPEFAAAFALRRDQEEFVLRAAKRAALNDTLNKVGQDFFEVGEPGQGEAQAPMRARPTFTRLLAIAAVLLLLIVAFWFISRPGLPDYRAYAQHAPLSLTVRGAADQAKSDAEKTFNAGDYVSALAALDRVLATEPENVTAQLNRGICLLETGRAEEARQVWSPMAAGNSALKGEARWYIALSYLYEKNWDRLKAALRDIPAGADHYEDAQKMLRSLK